MKLHKMCSIDSLKITFNHSSMDTQKIKDILKEYKQEHVERFASYITKLSKDPKSDFVNKYSEDALCSLFRRVEAEWLHFDGIHITLQSTGIFYDYVALKNKMLLVYPETIFDVNLVYEWDDFSFQKENGKVTYSHRFKNPFSKKETEIIGAYAIVKNKRGDFITLLSKDDLEKHRKTAKTDFIWKAWFTEMCMKTIVKKACKTHFGDIFTEIEEMDNENYDASKVMTNTKWLWFDDYLASIEMENDYEAIKVLHNECVSTLELSDTQIEYIGSVRDKKIEKLLNPEKHNRLPNNFQ